MSTEVFRFMDLPPEIRDRIYQIIFCTWPPPKSTYDEKRQLAVVPTSLAYVSQKIDIGLLLTNHQIYQDAMDVLTKGNLFVRVVFRGLHVRSIMMPKQVPIVAEGMTVVDAFKGYVMSHQIEMPDTGIFPPHHMMILWRDLDLFCQALATCGNGTITGTRSKHCVTVHNPFAETSTPNFLNLERQERLLQPYRKHLRGFVAFEVVGNVEASLAAAVSREVKRDPIQDPEELLQEMLQAKELGKRYFNQGNSNMASETWAKAALKLHKLVGSDVWPRMKAESVDDWSDKMTEIFFQLYSNLAANTLRVMRQKEADLELAGQYSGALYHAAQMASTASEVLQTNWRPTPEQEANLCYRLASAHRIARDSIEVAEHCINLAAQHLPNDVSIQQEKRSIAEWRASATLF
ncbi:hypothetical protein GGS21DRAFT_373714 [Xylaria nigripes]|nr:hypothetical protein GGS21DRAFT_373714 [Xylaria nigripes]